MSIIADFEQEDKQVFDVVNPHSTQEAAANAEQISEQWSVPQEPDDTEKMVSREVAKIRARNATEKRKRENRKALLSILVCLLVAAALLVVLAVPGWLIWLVNIGIVSCCTTAGIVADRYIRRNSRWQQ